MSLLDLAKQIANGAVIWGEWLGNSKQPVGYDVAQNRAIACLKCPKNKTGYPIREAAASAIKAQMELKKHLSLRVHGEKQLHTCSACGCPIRLKIWEQLSRVLPEPEEKSNYWEHCWLLNEKHE